MNTHLFPHINNNVVNLPYFLQWLPVLSHVNLYFILPTLPQQSFTNADGTPASRDSFLAALANIDAFLIRATYHDQMAFVRIADLTLDTAVPENTGQPRAGMVEKCQCPEGYTGLSCEVCVTDKYISYSCLLFTGAWLRLSNSAPLQGIQPRIDFNPIVRNKIYVFCLLTASTIN